MAAGHVLLQDCGVKRMPIVISSVRIPIEESADEAVDKAISLLGISRRWIKDAYVMKTSLDARRRNHMTLVCSVGVELTDPSREPHLAARRKNSMRGRTGHPMVNSRSVAWTEVQSPPDA